MKRTNKLLCILFSVVFVLGTAVLPAAAAQKSGKLGDTATWSFQNGTLTVSGTGVIPDFAISQAIQENGLQVKKAVVNKGIVSLGARAFSMCETLAAVSLPASMRIISRSCFECCTALKEIDIPNGVQYIASSAFQACTSLSKVTLPASLRMIDVAAFRGCSALTGIRLPAGLSYIGMQAFMETGLTDVVVPGSVRILDGWAFSQCHSLKSAVLSVGLTTLYDCTFQNSALEYVVLPKSVTTVSDLAFYYCTLKELYYEGTEAEFNAINIRREGEPLGVPGTTEEIFRTADLHINYNGLSARGDMDGKNGVGTADARTVLRTAVDLEQIQNGTYDFYRADVNFDAAISTADARLVLRDAVDLEDLTKSGAPQPKACTAAELDALATFSGTFAELLEQYQVPLLFGGVSTMAVFPGQKDVVVMMFQNDQPVFFCRRFTPTAALAQITAVAKDVKPDQILKTDPGAAAGIYSSLDSYFPYALMSCTTDGRVVVFGFFNEQLNSITVY